MNYSSLNAHSVIIVTNQISLINHKKIQIKTKNGNINWEGGGGSWPRPYRKESKPNHEMFR